MLMGGIPILLVLKSMPARSAALEEFKNSLYAEIQNGESVYDPFLKLLGKEHADIILEGEDTGYLPESLLHVAEPGAKSA